MTVQTLKIGGRKFVLVPKREFDRLAQKARLEVKEDNYWAHAALTAEAEARARGDKPIPFERVERELDEQRAAASGNTRRERGRR